MNKGNLRTHSTKTNGQKKSFVPFIPIIIVAIVVAVIIIATKATAVDETFGDNPRVNLTGREASDEYTDNVNDPEIRTSEEEKLGTVLGLISAQEWENANALFGTIFPNYLDTCGKYDYYQAAMNLADNYEGFSVERETVETRLEVLSKRCKRADAEGE